MQSILDNIMKNTEIYLESKTKNERKSIGQFFTSENTARFMASLYSLPQKYNITILDAGAGSGILSVALIERLIIEGLNYKSINLVCYENNSDILPLLSENLQFAKKNCKLNLSFTIKQENYILSQAIAYKNKKSDQMYDLIIGNPPYMKISKDAPEALTMPNICYGAPNMYFLFSAMSLFNLLDKGEMVYIIPRSWTSGAYFKYFRQYFLTHGKIIHIHLFVSRDKVFQSESVLQETMIIKVVKTEEVPMNIKITTSETNNDFSNITEFVALYNTVVPEKADRYVYLVTQQSDIDVLQKINSFSLTLPSAGYKMKTGLTVDFRNKDVLRDNRTDQSCPLFYSQHIQNGKVIFPIGKQAEYIETMQSGLLQKNSNYLFVKRFTSKEERRRLQCGMYFSKEYSEYDKISTQNKINFIAKSDAGQMIDDEVYGLYVLFNSTIYDEYYRILNGSTQVNSTEVNSIPVPPKDDIVKIGKLLRTNNDYSTEKCDLILEETQWQN